MRGHIDIITILCRKLNILKYEILLFQNKLNPFKDNLQYPHIAELLIQKEEKKEYLIHKTFNFIEMIKIYSEKILKE